MDTLASKLKEQNDRIYFLHDNARPHIAKLTNSKLLELKWITLPHPPYSPDLAPTDYHLFRSLSSSLKDQHFQEEEDIKSFISDFFNNKSSEFYKEGIMSLPSRWQQVVDSNGEYITN